MMGEEVSEGVCGEGVMLVEGGKGGKGRRERRNKGKSDIPSLSPRSP